jgi:tRNA A37 threonylcarbamoyladenosine dehydratase
VPAARYLRAAHVAVVGIGGVGSWAAESLARSGVGRLTLIDMDHIAESNINRQVHALDGTLGMAKVRAMADRITQINPDCQVHRVEDFASPVNWPHILPESVNAVIDACDQVQTKAAMAAWAQASGVAFVTVGAAGGKRLAHEVAIDDLSNVTHDPLLAQVRYRLRRYHGAARPGQKIGVACVFSREAVRAPDASCAVDGDGSLNCHGYGSLVSVTATFGHCAAGWIFEQLLAKARN